MQTRTLAAGILLLTLFLLPAACGEAVTEIPGIRPTSTKTRIPTLTPRPTSTPQLTQTMEMAASQTKHMEAYQTQEARNAPTEEAFQATLAQFPIKCDLPGPFLVSPDGNWLAYDCALEGPLTVVNKDRDTMWTVPYSDIYARGEEYGASLKPFYWSNESQYLYFIAHACCGGDGIDIDISGGGAGGPLYRLDVNTGNQSLVIAGDPLSMIYYSFSSTGRKLLYIHEFQTPLEINILDLKTGAENSYELDDYQAADSVVWSPDGRSFALMIANGSWYGMSDVYSVMLFNLKENTQRTIIFRSEHNHLPVEWTENDILTIQILPEYSNDPDPVELLFFDVNSNSFISPTPTP
jgi:hypothetical protein